MKHENPTHFKSVTVNSVARAEIRGGTLRIRGKDTPPLTIGHVAQIVGRDESCDLVLADGKVSAIHLELAAGERGVRIRDLGSRNGTYVGRTRLADGYLTEPTTITVGDTLLEFQPSRPERVAVPEAAEFGPLVAASQSMRRAAMERAHVRGYLRRHGIGS